MRRGGMMQLTNARANPLDEFNATIPGLDNMLPTLPKAIPGANFLRVCHSARFVVWPVMRTPHRSRRR